MVGIKKRILILGAAGRDFHNFLVKYKDNPQYEVVAFTQAQIPGIEKRSFPKELAGKYYTKDIPFYPEEKLVALIKTLRVYEVVLAYSDLPHLEVMHKASIVLAAGANFTLLGTNDTQLTSKKPVVAVTAVRTGCGKSPVSRHIGQFLKESGKNVVAVRHPMPYGDLRKQVCQRFASYEDLKKYNCTIEEREEYEPWIEMNIPIYAGVDYAQILREAEREADIILWDGGNNDLSFFKPNVLVTLVDPLRPGHELSYYPGEANLRAADIIVIAKMTTAKKKNIRAVMHNSKKVNQTAVIIKSTLTLQVANPEQIQGKKVLVIEDGPTLTHGGMAYGAGYLTAIKYGGKICTAEPYAVGSLQEVYKKYPHLHSILPAMGYSEKQRKELEQTINKTPCDLVIDGSPVNLARLLRIRKPVVNVSYAYEDIGEQTLSDTIMKRLEKQ